MHTPIVIVLAITCLAGPALSREDVPSAPTRYTGSIHYLHGTWPVRIDLDAVADGRAVMVFSALGLAGIEVPAELDSETLKLDIPYGIGAQTLHRASGTWRTQASPDDPDSLAIVLEPDTLPRPSTTTMTFRNDDLSMEGTLWTPGGAPGIRYPLVVVGHGASRYSREMPEYRFWAEHLTRLGYAAFIYDKRGIGASQGVYENASLTALSDDLVAATRAALSHEQVDPHRVALLGGSQFGWTGFRAARSLDVKAMVVTAPPSVDPVTIEVRVLADSLRSAGLTDAALADAMAYVRLYFAAARHHELFDALVALAARSAETDWIGHVPVPSRLEDIIWWGEQASFDPTADILAFTSPLLIVYGREDTLVTPQVNALRFESLLKQAGTPFDLWIAEEADHRIEVPSRVVDGALRFPQYAPGLLERIEAFLARTLALQS